MPPKSDKKGASANSDPSHSYSVGDIVLAKLKGFPAWPGQIVAESEAPPKVLRERPGKAKNINLVQFFPVGDYSWLQSRDLSALTPREIEAYTSSGSKKKGELLEAYRVAQDPSDWKRERADKQAEYEAALEQAQLEEDELADDDAAGDDKGAAGGKKRKRAPQNNGAAPKKKTGKSDKGGKKDDDAPAAKKAKTSANSDDPAEMVKSWRHKLQKVFLGKNDPPADEMPKCAEYFDAMEAFDMKKDWLVESKLAKVLKRIALMKDGAIPDEDKYSFRDRSSKLATKWASLLGGAATDSPAPPAADDKADAPAAANGDAAEPAAPAAEEPAPAAADAKMDEDKKEDAAPAAAEAAPAANGDAAPAPEAKADAPAADEPKAEAPAEATA
ncbi:uncharacterized protein JCM10292_001363 [Rhodotorula paludigena]|uniref:uncharacterized protein n=1 Tax=Rhodotorula paludigena TaxID=86838 RepID=UPI003181B922